MKKRVISLILTFLCVLSAGCGKNVYDDVPELITPVGKSISETEVIRTDLYTTTTINGEVLPKVTEYGFETTGVVTYVYVEIGDYVKAGDVLAEIDSTSAQAEVESIQEAIDEIDQQYDFEIRKLQDENKKSSITWQQKELNELIISQYEKLKVERTSAYEDKLALAKEKLLKTKIIAEESGRVTAMNLSSGRWAYEGNACIAVANESEHYIVCKAVEDELMKTADRMLTLNGGNVYSLTFLRNDKEEDPEYSYFTVPGLNLKSGDYAPIIIISDFVENVVAVPNDCLYKESNSYFVYVIEDGTRVKKNVTPGFVGINYTEITEGVSEGDRIYIKEEASTSSHKAVATRGDFAITNKVKTKTNYSIQQQMYAEKNYGYLVFNGFVAKTYSRINKGDVIAKYTEFIDDNVIAETKFALEYAKLSNAWEDMAYYENMLEDMEESMGEKEITAPYDGMIISVSEIFPGGNVGNDGKVCMFAGTDNLLLSVDNANNAFRYGQTVLLTANVGGKELQCNGTVITASNTALSSRLTGKTALIEVDPGNEELYFNNTVFASVNTVAIEDVVMIPVDSVKQENGELIVLIADEDGELKKTRFVNGRKGQSYYWAVDGVLGGQEIYY